MKAQYEKKLREYYATRTQDQDVIDAKVNIHKRYFGLWAHSADEIIQKAKNWHQHVEDYPGEIQ